MKSLGLSKSSKSSHSDHHSSSKLSSSTSSKKRARSISRSESPPPKRKHRPFADDDELDVSAEIWKMFGKNRNTYVSRDVMSDDEDMEADAGSLEQEELRRYVGQIGSTQVMTHFVIVTVLPNARNRRRWKRNADTKKRNGGEKRLPLVELDSFHPFSSFEHVF